MKAIRIHLISDLFNNLRADMQTGRESPKSFCRSVQTSHPEIRKLIEICEELELHVSVDLLSEPAEMIIGKFAGLIEGHDQDALTALLSVQDYRQTCDIVLYALRSAEKAVWSELSRRTYLLIDSKKAEYYEGKHLFGKQVSGAFPSAVLDIEEAGKCLAVNRNTACVFHLMRVLEYAVRALGKSLKDPNMDPKKNPSWGVILGRCNDELAKNKLKRSPQWAADDAFFSQATALLLAVKEAWRNRTMHVEQSYDAERALEVYGASRTFMRHLASKLKE